MSIMDRLHEEEDIYQKFAEDFCNWLSTPGKTIIPASAYIELAERLRKFSGVDTLADIEFEEHRRELLK